MVKLVSALAAKKADEETIRNGVSSVDLMKKVAAGVLENCSLGEVKNMKLKLSLKTNAISTLMIVTLF